MSTMLRHWEYYNLTDTFSNLYEQSRNGKTFNRLYEILFSKENILLSYRTIKSNPGSTTTGADGKTIEDIEKQTEEELINKIQRKLSNYQPKSVRRVFIPKPNGDKRPLGIPCIEDRIIQQCMKQILEPICEAKFYKHSYGFRPLRSTHHAISRASHLINKNLLHYAVDIDIKGFFDNVNHTKLSKQLWNMGIRDRKVLRIISKMLKTEIEGEGKPTKGTPQGGIISPLLSNIVLNDLDQWIAGQWETFETQYKYIRNSDKIYALKSSNLKEGYIVRYADDFKIFCRDHKTAYKWYRAVKRYLYKRLKLEINPEKSKVINLRKNESEFLGFTLKAIPKKNRYVSRSGIKEKKRQGIKEKLKQAVKELQRNPSGQTALKFNQTVLGLHNYFRKATMVNREFSKISFQVSRTMYNRLRNKSVYGIPIHPPPYNKFYHNRFKTYKVGEVYLYPIADVKMERLTNFSQELTPYTKQGRDMIFRELKPDIRKEIVKLMKMPKQADRSIEYYDNRLSRYSMKIGKCEVTGTQIPAELVHCHHKTPVSLGGSDDFDNLVILHKSVHKLLHATQSETINKYLMELLLNYKQLRKVNSLRKHCLLEKITK